MAVVSDMQLPDQPATGSAVWVPLGGDGWVAPVAAFSVLNQVVMDASGTTATAIVRFDPRFESICVLAQSLVTGFSSSVENELSLIQKEPATGHRAQAFGDGIFMNTLSDHSLFSWSPPLLIGQDRIQCVVVNTDGDTLNFRVQVYMFNIRVFEKVPLNVILASIPSIEGQNV